MIHRRNQNSFSFFPLTLAIGPKLFLWKGSLLLALLLTSFLGCKSSNSKTGPTPGASSTPSSNVAGSNPSAPPGPPSETQLTPTAAILPLGSLATSDSKPNSEVAAKTLPPLLPPKAVDPEKALGWLKNGNLRFVSGKLRKDGQSPKDIQRLSRGQKPHSILISCSDSQVPPEVIFDQKLGEIYVLRSAGPSLDVNTIGAVEYATQALGTRLIVVMGHSSCGTLKAALTSKKGGSTGSEMMDRMLKDMHPRLPDSDAQGSLAEEAKTNASRILQELLEKSSVIKDLTQSGHLKLQPALYDLSSGKVEFF